MLVMFAPGSAEVSPTAKLPRVQHVAIPAAVAPASPARLTLTPAAGVRAAPHPPHCHHTVCRLPRRAADDTLKQPATRKHPITSGGGGVRCAQGKTSTL